MWVLLAFLACSNRPPAPAPEPVPAPAAAPRPAPSEVPGVGEANTACFERCMRDSMARPVSHEVIEADCLGACTPQGVVRGSADLSLRLGQRVVVEGLYQATLHHGHGPEPYMGTAIVLPDDTPLWISTGEAPTYMQKWLDQSIHVEATLTPGKGTDPGIWLTALGEVSALPDAGTP